jgi:hypothetical protein
MISADQVSRGLKNWGCDVFQNLTSLPFTYFYQFILIDNFDHPPSASPAVCPPAITRPSFARPRACCCLLTAVRLVNVTSPLKSEGLAPE